jgi:hypothetical protein
VAVRMENPKSLAVAVLSQGGASVEGRVETGTAMKVTILAAALMLAARAATADPECATTACRPGGFDLAIRLEDDHYKAVTVTPTPYVMGNGTILIVPGETIAVQFTLVNGQIAGPATFLGRFAPHLPVPIANGQAPVPNPQDAGLPVLAGNSAAELLGQLPPNSLLLSYGQDPVLATMYLDMYSNLPRRLKLDAVMSIFGHDSFVTGPTALCPISPMALDHEIWPDPVGPLALTNPHLLADGEKAHCY